MESNDSDNLVHWEGMLSPVERKALSWIVLDRTRPFCSEDLIEFAGIRSKGVARNINWRFKKLGIIELYCKSIYAFYKLKTVNSSDVKKPMTLYRMGGNGPRRIQVDLVSLLGSLPAEELCKVHDIRLIFYAEHLYKLLLSIDGFKPSIASKDIFFGFFSWSKYRSVQVVFHSNGTVSFVLDCGNCPMKRVQAVS